MITATKRNTNSGTVNREGNLYIVPRIRDGRQVIEKCPWRELSQVERTWQIEAERRAIYEELFNPCGLY